MKGKEPAFNQLTATSESADPCIPAAFKDSPNFRFICAATTNVKREPLQPNTRRIPKNVHHLPH